MNLVRFDTFEASPVAGEGEGAAPGGGGTVLVLARGRRHLHLLLGAHEGGEAEVPLLDLGPHLRLDAEQVLVLDIRQHLVKSRGVNETSRKFSCALGKPSLKKNIFLLTCVNKEIIHPPNC